MVSLFLCPLLSPVNLNLDNFGPVVFLIGTSRFV